MKKKIIAISVSLLIALILLSAVMCLTSSAVLHKQHGGIPNSSQEYEYYSFEGHSCKLYQMLLSAKYACPDDSLSVSNEAYMRLLVDNELGSLPDSYLSANYIEYNVFCNVTENTYRRMKLDFTGVGTSNNKKTESIAFSITVDWFAILQNDGSGIELIY